MGLNSAIVIAIFVHKQDARAQSDRTCAVEKPTQPQLACHNAIIICLLGGNGGVVGRWQASGGLVSR